MLIDEILHTCSNEKVAQAAVASLGLGFVSRVKSAADDRGITVGAFAAKVVREFGDDAQACERRAVDRAMHRADQPILRGLEIILERELEMPSLLDHRRRSLDERRRADGSGCIASLAG